MRAIWPTGAALAALAVAAPLIAAPADTIRSRVDNYRELGAACKAVNDGLRGDVQWVLLSQSVRQIRNASRGQYEWFPQGSGPQSGVKTRAKADIWAQPAKFKANQDAFAKAADDLQKAVAAKDAAAVRVSARNLGGACKSCHDTFRTPEG